MFDYLKVPGHWKARGPNQGGRGGGQAGGKDGLGGGGGQGGGNHGGKGSDKEDRDLARQLDKVRGLPGSGVGGRVDGRPSDTAPTTNPLDRLFGYQTVGQRRAAYNNNPNPAGRSINPVAMVPSFPWASRGYVFGSILGAPMSPIGAAMAVPGIASAMANNRPYESMPQQIAREVFGAERGPQGPDVGVGTDRAGAGGNLSGLLASQPTTGTGLLSATQPTSQIQSAIDQASALKKRAYALGLNGVPGPTPYSYQTARWL